MNELLWYEQYEVLQEQCCHDGLNASHCCSHLPGINHFSQQCCCRKQSHATEISHYYSPQQMLSIDEGMLPSKNRHHSSNIAKISPPGAADLHNM